MADTGAPWNLPYPLSTDLVRDGAQAIEDLAEATATGLSAAGASQSVTLIATDATYTIPVEARKPGVKVTVIGGGGGGGGGTRSLTPAPGNGGTGGTTTFEPTGMSPISAAGGGGGLRAVPSSTAPAGTAGLASGNQGIGGNALGGGSDIGTGTTGGGGRVVVEYVDLTGVTTAEVTIGAGGAGGAAGSQGTAGSAGGRGEIILEF